ncbi:MAG: regulatory protein RecX [Elusimicrobia bacterium]|nr:regulatory protein RecX [Elusimicrobiota bacterium]
MKTPYDAALGYALALLSRRSHSRKEIEDKLAAKKYEPAVATAVIGRLFELKYLNDEQFAKEFFTYQLNRGKGAEVIRFELLKKGIDTALVTGLLRAYKENPETEIEHIKTLARNRFKRMQGLPPRDAARRLMHFLARRGFSLDGIQKSLQQLQIEIQDEEDIKEPS